MSGSEQRKQDSTRPQIEAEIVKKVVLVGRDNVPVDPEEVYKLSKLWCTYKEMADWFGLHPDTLKFNFNDEIERGRSETKQALRRVQIEQALKGDKTMLIWLGKNILGQSDNPNDSISNAPLPWTDDIDNKKGTDDGL